MSKSDDLSSIKAYFIPLKLGSYQIETLKHGLEKAGGEACSDQVNANVILTALTSDTRIKRHLKNHNIPVVKVDWLKECLKKHEKIPMDSYQIQNFHSDTTTHSSSTVHPQQSHQPQQPSIRLVRTGEVLNRWYDTMPPDTMPSFDEEDEGSLKKDDTHRIAPDFINTKYECLRNTPLEARHNKKLVFLLRLMERQRYMDMQDKNALSYRHALAAIKAYPRKIRSADEAKQIVGIGKKISDLIRMYLETGTIPDAEDLLGDTKFRTLSLFNKVFGVGPSTASLWYAQGYRTLQDVLDRAKLAKAVKLGIELLPDLEQPMSRQDAKELIDIIGTEIKDVDSQAFATPVGGYRRGKKENGDLDIIISSRRLQHGTDLFLQNILHHLTGKGYVKHVLLISDKGTTSYGNHYSSSGADMEKLDTCFTAFLQPSTQTLRQVDFIVTSLDEYPYAVLGWTGSQQFVRSHREYAKKVIN
ncbi:hypothetical protein BDA99DRAFT_507687 [Phascolomyces articulosus]|uniref:DNA polymerase n=1 Tax=Phascolomyces articulosus TaxID=60185 RepID=A0AAD5PGL0_9FUNG|nr:hypothetical protein BDA99DRAFT_507687 [Phascolomyces articulosus]